MITVDTRPFKKVVGWLTWLCPTLLLALGFFIGNLTILTDSRPAIIDKLQLSFGDVARSGQLNANVFGPDASRLVMHLRSRGIDFSAVEIESAKTSLIDPLSFSARVRVGRPENSVLLLVQGSGANSIRSLQIEQ